MSKAESFYKCSILNFILRKKIRPQVEFQQYKCSFKSERLLWELIVYFFLFLLPQVTKAQDTTRLWTLQQCFDYAQSNNIPLRILQKDVEISNQNFLQAKAAQYPNLSGSVSQNLINARGGRPLSGNYGLNSSVLIYQGGSLKNNIYSQQLNIQAANLNVQQALNNLTIQITQAYLNILLAKENITALQNVVTTSQAQFDHGKVLFDAGSIPKNSLVQLQATLATDQYNLVLAQSQLQQNVLMLKQILELPTGYNFQIPDQQIITVPEEVTNLQTVQDSALSNRPEIKLGENELTQSDLQLKQSYTTGLPTLSAGASLGSGYSNGGAGKYFGQIGNNFSQQIGVTLGVPLFNNRTTKTNVEKAKISIDQSKLSLSNTRLELSQQVEQSYINLLNAKAQYQAALVQFNANQENYRVASEELKLGAVNMVDFLVQKNQFIQAEQTLIQTKYSVILNHGIYEFYMGKPITL